VVLAPLRWRVLQIALRKTLLRLQKLANQLAVLLLLIGQVAGFPRHESERCPGRRLLPHANRVPAQGTRTVEEISSACSDPLPGTADEDTARSETRLVSAKQAVRFTYHPSRPRASASGRALARGFIP
jgi:hypothetical protein